MPLQVLRPYHSKGILAALSVMYIRDTFKNHVQTKMDKMIQVVHLVGKLIGMYKETGILNISFANLLVFVKLNEFAKKDGDSGNAIIIIKFFYHLTCIHEK